MQQLHLVGFTTDHRGLIFSVRRGAKSGGFVVQLDESVMTAVEELRALVAEEQADDAKASTKRPESSLSVREVQARLRRGRTIEQVELLKHEPDFAVARRRTDLIVGARIVGAIKQVRPAIRAVEEPENVEERGLP